MGRKQFSKLRPQNGAAMRGDDRSEKRARDVTAKVARWLRGSPNLRMLEGTAPGVPFDDIVEFFNTRQTSQSEGGKKGAETRSQGIEVRDQKILDLLSSGMSVAQVARRFNLTARQIRNIRRKKAEMK